MAIRVRLAGGLGNQLFQLNSALILNDLFNLNEKIIINSSYLNSYTSKRESLITNFFFFFYTGSRVVFYDSKEMAMNLRFSKLIGYIVEKNLSGVMNYNSLIRSVNHLIGNLFLDGYYQNNNPFKVHFKLQSVKDNILSHASQILDKLGLEKDFYAMHVRRGDYLTDKSARKIFNIIEMPFYRKINNDYFNHDLPLVIFSDDLRIAKLFAKEFHGIHFYDKGLNILDEFALMAKASGIAISNSTFPWWATILGGEKPYGSFSPKNWYKKKSYNDKNTLNKIKIINVEDNKIC